MSTLADAECGLWPGFIVIVLDRGPASLPAERRVSLSLSLSVLQEFELWEESTRSSRTYPTHTHKPPFIG